MKSKRSILFIFTILIFACLFVFSMRNNDAVAAKSGADQQKMTNIQNAIEEGKKIFRFDTFGNEPFWGGALQLHQAIAGSKLGGVGPGISPKAALGVGLKVSTEELPPAVIKALKAGKVNLDDPATTMTLLAANAVVGVKASFDRNKKIQTIGITCAFCHSTVDNSLAPGVGKRLDGWPNRDLNVGGIVALAPNLQPLADRLGVDVPTVKKVLGSWGPGRYDAELNMDGKAFRPDGKTAATLLPAAFGLRGVNLHTYTGWGSVPYWNAYVAITQMRGQGTFYDPRLNNQSKFPLAVKTGEWNIRPKQDMVSSKLPSLHLYQISIPAPQPPAGSFKADAAIRGQRLFNTKANCARCHVPPAFTEPGWSMHSASEIGIDDFQAMRSPYGMYRTTPLKGLFTRAKGGFYHDGRFPTLMDVVNHYDTFFRLGLSQAEKNDLIEYLKSL